MAVSWCFAANAERPKGFPDEARGTCGLVARWVQDRNKFQRRDPMKKIMVLGLALALAPAAAFAQAATDADFAKNAAIGGMAEVQAGKLAVAYGSGDAKTIGQQMVTDHTKMNMELTALAKSKGMALPASLDTTHTAMINDLSKTTGHGFDRKYLTGQVTEHQKTIALFQQEADHGTDPDLKALAAKALPELQQHLNMFQAAAAKTS
jgi:predicted outer membrane protein